MEVETTSRKLRLDLFNQGSDVFQPASKKTRLSKLSDTATNAQVTREHYFTMADVQKCLYCPRTAKTVPVTKPQDTAKDTQDTACFWCDASITELNFKCPLHKHDKGTSQPAAAAELPLAVRSFPPEAGFCVSNIPGAGLGICAKRVIPVGAWIGPYEGTFVRPEELSYISDTSYMWEIYKEEKLSGFIDGSDEMTSSWMRYIRCARHKQEQNLFAFQYLGKVYYRSFKPILPGQEMLVWYDEKYPQYLGIPSAIFDLGQIGTKQQSNSVGVGENVVFNYAPPTPPSSVPSPSSPTTPNPVSQPINSQHFSPIRPTSSEHLNGFQPKMTSEFELPSRFCRTEKPNPETVTPVEEEASSQSPTLPLLVADNTPAHKDGEGKTSVKSNETVFTQVTESSLWRCGQCKKSFPQRTMLQIHICEQTPKKPYQCGHCSESFSRPTELRSHAVIHASKKPFKCGFCSRAFAGSTTLNNHIRTHTGEKPFVCEACGKHFTQGSQLSRHHRIPGDCVGTETNQVHLKQSQMEQEYMKHILKKPLRR